MFKEMNLRTYVYDERGEPGVWFFTLECNQWLAVKLARLLFHLPYQHAKMSAEEKDGTLHYLSQRKEITLNRNLLTLHPLSVIPLLKLTRLNFSCSSVTVSIVIKRGNSTKEWCTIHPTNTLLLTRPPTRHAHSHYANLRNRTPLQFPHSLATRYP